MFAVESVQNVATVRRITFVETLAVPSVKNVAAVRRIAFE